MGFWVEGWLRGYVVVRDLRGLIISVIESCVIGVSEVVEVV